MGKKVYRIGIGIFSIILILFLFGCGGDTKQPKTKPAQEDTTLKAVKEDLQDIVKKFESYSFEKRGKALAEAKKSVEIFEKRIDSIEAKWDSTQIEKTEKAQEKWKNLLTKLKKHHKQLNNKLDSLETSSAEARHIMREGLGTSI